MRSVLRDLRHAAEMPGYFEFPDGDAKADRIRRARARRAGAIWSEQHIRLPAELRPYLLDRHHDAMIPRIERQNGRHRGGRLILTAEDRDLNTLAGARYGHDPAIPPCTFDLVFEGVTYAEHRRAGDDDRLRWSPPPERMPQWLFARFVDLDAPGYRWILNYDPRDHRRETGFLLVEAAEIRVVPFPRARWIERYGPNAEALFDRYEAVRPEMMLAYSPHRVAELGVDWPPRATVHP